MSLCEPKKVSIDDIIVPQERLRSIFDEETLQYLRGSIAKFGIVSPIIVAPGPENKYILVDGEHRLKEAKNQGINEVEVMVCKMSEKEQIMVNILLNVARGRINPMHMARWLRKAHELGFSKEELAKMCGKSKSWVDFMLELTELPEEIQRWLEEEKITPTHVKICSALDSPYEIYECLKTAANLGWTTSVTKHYVENRKAELEAYSRALAEGRVEGPPPPPKPEELVQVTQCFICNRFVPNKEITIPKICNDCRMLLEYIVSNIGTGKEAMDIVYQALTDYINRKRKFETIETEQTETPAMKRRPKRELEEEEYEESEEEYEEEMERPRRKRKKHREMIEDVYSVYESEHLPARPPHPSAGAPSSKELDALLRTIHKMNKLLQNIDQRLTYLESQVYSQAQSQSHEEKETTTESQETSE